MFVFIYIYSIPVHSYYIVHLKKNLCLGNKKNPLTFDIYFFNVLNRHFVLPFSLNALVQAPFRHRY